MSIPDPGPDSQTLSRLPGPRDEDRPETPPPPGLRGGTAGRDETVAYIPKEGLSPARAGAERGESHAESGLYPFLDPPRGPGELGWMSCYRVRRLLGEGGMGLVFQAEDTELLRPVALKVIRPELADNPLSAKRFLREARAMAALKHDHIVTIYQVGQERGVPFLAMEYLRGMSLDHWLDRGHKPSPDLVLRIGREIAAGLAAAHERGLIHRDIKPANIWLEAPSGRVKILDFGLARTESDDVKITNPGIALGTPAYMAPEQARGSGVGAFQRPVQPRLRVIRTLYRAVTVPGDDTHGRADVPLDGYPLATSGPEPRGAAGAGRAGHAVAGQGAGGPAAVGRGGGRGDQGHRARTAGRATTDRTDSDHAAAGRGLRETGSGRPRRGAGCIAPQGEGLGPPDLPSGLPGRCWGSPWSRRESSCSGEVPGRPTQLDGHWRPPSQPVRAARFGSPPHFRAYPVPSHDRNRRDLRSRSRKWSP